MKTDLVNMCILLIFSFFAQNGFRGSLLTGMRQCQLLKSCMKEEKALSCICTVIL